MALSSNCLLVMKRKRIIDQSKTNMNRNISWFYVILDLLLTNSNRLCCKQNVFLKLPSSLQLVCAVSILKVKFPLIFMIKTANLTKPPYSGLAKQTRPSPCPRSFFLFGKCHLTRSDQHISNPTRTSYPSVKHKKAPGSYSCAIIILIYYLYGILHLDG